jgi:hypothetical protein
MRDLATSVRVLALLSSAAIGAAAQAPATDIFLAPLSVKDGVPVVGKPVNVTSRPGYDNQPSFTPDSHTMLFTATHEDGQSDIYRLDLSSRIVSRVTSTPESEYSATVMPGGKRFSVIRVEKDSTQRLWSFAMDGNDPKLVIESLKPVGYHAWIDANNLALFVLGRPNALVHYDMRTAKSDTLARDIGRSLLPLPSKDGFSFVQRVDSTFTIKAMSWPSGTTRDLVALPQGAQDLVWLGRDLMMTSSGSRLLYWKPDAKGWRDAGDYANAGLSSISRLSVSPDGRWLAIVAMPKP